MIPVEGLVNWAKKKLFDKASNISVWKISESVKGFYQKKITQNIPESKKKCWKIGWNCSESPIEIILRSKILLYLLNKPPGIVREGYLKILQGFLQTLLHKGSRNSFCYLRHNPRDWFWDSSKKFARIPPIIGFRQSFGQNI